MKRKHRYIIPAFFSALLAAPLLLLFLLQLVQFQLKLSASFRMKTEQLITVRLPAEKVVWEKMDKEIVIDGKMFDIKTYSVENGLFTATGFMDEKETKIRDLLGNQAKKQADASVLRLMLFIQCFAALVLWLLAPVAGRLLKRGYAVLYCHYQSAYITIPGPPPRCH